MHVMVIKVDCCQAERTGIKRRILESGLIPKRCFVNGMFLTVALPRFFSNTNVENKSCLHVCEPIEDIWGTQSMWGMGHLGSYSVSTALGALSQPLPGVSEERARLELGKCL